MQPVVCNKDMAVSFPLKDGDCQFWLEIVDSVDDITNPSRDHAYVDSKGLFYIYNGKEIQVINDHANLKIKWGNMIGDISNQLDLMEIINQFVKTISVNGTNIAKDNEKNIAIQVPITTIKLDGNTISPVDYIVNLDLASVYAKKTEIPKNVSELENDAGYIKQEVVDQLIPIKAIKVNDVTIQPDETHTVNIETGYVTPEMFGAVGDGVTDDSTAFNLCFTKAMETGKFILLSNKTYLITSQLTNIENTNIIGINTKIKLGNNAFIGKVTGCYFEGILFYREIGTIMNFINEFLSSQLKLCTFKNMNILFRKVSPRINSLEHVLLDECYLYNTCLNTTVNDYSGSTYLINNTTIKFVFEDLKYHPYFISGIIGGTFIFNNCTFDRDLYGNDNVPFFYTRDNLIFNNCNIKVDTKMIRIINNNDDRKIEISFNNCIIENLNKILINVTTENILIPRFKIVNSKLNTGKIIESNIECSLWLENNIMDTKPIINSGKGKVNLVEIQQKYSDTSQNVFPWISEIPSTYENNVKLSKNGTNYYVLTENEDKTIKKLDYYLKYTQNHTAGAAYFSTSEIIRGIDVSGYTLKTSMLKNNIFKLTDSNGELIDYVYTDLSNASVSGGVLDGSPYIQIDMQFTPVMTKWAGQEDANGSLDLNTCITLILEKTSS